MTGAVDDRRFFEHLGASDVVLSLRYPTMGESSATMMQAMSCGKPVITTDHAQFAEEKAAVRIPAGEGEVAAVAEAVARLATCPTCYGAVAAASRSRAAEGDMDRVVARWLEVVDSVLRARGVAERGAGGQPGSGPGRRRSVPRCHGHATPGHARSPMVKRPAVSAALRPVLDYFDHRFQDLHDHIDDRIQKVEARVATEVETISELTLGMQRFVDTSVRQVGGAGHRAP